MGPTFSAHEPAFCIISPDIPKPEDHLRFFSPGCPLFRIRPEREGSIRHLVMEGKKDPCHLYGWADMG